MGLATLLQVTCQLPSETRIIDIENQETAFLLATSEAEALKLSSREDIKNRKSFCVLLGAMLKDEGKARAKDYPILEKTMRKHPDMSPTAKANFSGAVKYIRSQEGSHYKLLIPYFNRYCKLKR